ncbi:MAG: glycosyltransferase [Oxalobacteraceae bacterium]|nr:MAG: glycosyltransferase [Oxalobacteraceae bacterium]
MQSHLAIIICTWNRAQLLDQTLAGLSKISAADIDDVPHLILVDNNSSDDTRAVAGRHEALWPAGRFHYVFEHQQGKQFALNSGIKAAVQLGCTICAFTDDDIDVPADWSQRIIAAFDDATVDLTGGKTLLQWSADGPPVWFHRNMIAILAGVDEGDQRLCPPPAGYAPAGSNMAARMALFERVGGFSPTHFRHMDFEFGQRCLRMGVGVSYEPGLVVVAPVDPQVLTKRYFRRWAFKAGITPWQDMQPGVRHVAWVPAWLYRQLLQDAALWLIAPLRGEPQPERFARELRIWRALGTISSRWISRLRPTMYPEWVKARSQKRQNVY